MKVICDICGALIGKRGLLRHKISVHEKKKDFVCNICGMAFAVKYKLDYHQYKHSDVRNFPCAICGKTFKTRSDMLQHEKKHTSGMYRCFECSAEFESRINLDSHTKENHNKKATNTIESLDCKLCLKTFTRKEHVRRHMKTVHEKKISELNLQEFKSETGDFFFCSKCDFKEFDQELFLSHLEVCLKKSRVNCIPCDRCDRKFARKDHLQRHIQTVHSESRDFVCEICLKSFKINQDLKTHIKKVHNRPESKVSCNECNRSFVHESSLKEHILSVHENKKEHKCDVVGCPAAFSKKSRLKYHKQAVHVLKIFTCDMCGLNLYNKIKLKFHLLSHIKNKLYKSHEVDEIQIKQEVEDNDENSCEIFVSEIKLDPNDYCHDNEFESVMIGTETEETSQDQFGFQAFHEIGKDEVCDENSDESSKNAVEESVDPKRFNCSFCKKHYASRRGVRAHCRKKHADQLPPLNNDATKPIRGLKINGSLICDYCGDILKTKSTLLIHFRKHLKSLGDRYVCQHCGKCFNHFSSFQLHRRNHTKDFRKNCPYCERKFLTNQTLTWHIDYHHLNKPAIPKEVCSICGKSVQKFYMKIHLKTHLGTYSCSTCGRGCITEESLKYHELQHSKERPFECTYCEKSYTFEKNLKFHIRKFHADIPNIEKFISTMSQRNKL